MQALQIISSFFLNRYQCHNNTSFLLFLSVRNFFLTFQTSLFQGAKSMPDSPAEKSAKIRKEMHSGMLQSRMKLPFWQFPAKVIFLLQLCNIILLHVTPPGRLTEYAAVKALTGFSVRAGPNQEVIECALGFAAGLTGLAAFVDSVLALAVEGKAVICEFLEFAWLLVPGLIT